MARIKQYDAPIENITESTRGTAAFEQAGRRLGPLYNEAATFQRRTGEAQAQSFKDLEWPFDIAKLQEQSSSGRTKIDTSGLGNGKGITASERFPTLQSSNEIDDATLGTSRSHVAVGQISRGAAAIGSALSDGGYKVAGDYTLNQGRLVSVSADQKITNAYNNKVEADVSDNAQKVSDYWNQYYGGVAGATNMIDAGTSSDLGSQTGQTGTGLFDNLASWTGAAENTAATDDGSSGGSVATTDTGL